MSSRSKSPKPSLPEQQLWPEPAEPSLAPSADDSEALVRRSALWAAWGDALGFITEFARDAEDLQNRAGAARITEPVEWRRRIGGRFGPTVPLPAGVFSDDTQLRLAVSRSIRAGGRFDVETFSKIELPVFLAYGLGVGRGTRAAGASLAKRGIRWATNFYDEPRARYVDGGGNGAAMRVQPHVWAAPNFRHESYLSEVIVDAVSTHGHPRGVLGALFHALALGHALRFRELPEPRRWLGIARYLQRAAELPHRDEVLRDRWLPLWEQRAGKRWVDAVGETVAEIEQQVSMAVEEAGDHDLSDSYARLARRLGGLDARTRGAGTTTAVLALWLSWRGRDDPAGALAIAANLLGSDTDTIASMAGALLGPVAVADPPTRVLDADYIVAEANRCVAVGRGDAVDDFPHPDLIRWTPPRALVDTVGRSSTGAMNVAGLGEAEFVGAPVGTDERGGAVWQWTSLAFGQTLLMKRRTDLRELPDESLPLPRPRRRVSEDVPADPPGRRRASGERAVGIAPQLTLARAVRLVKEHEFDPATIGTLLMFLIEEDDGLDRATAFVGAISEAYQSRSIGE